MNIDLSHSAIILIREQIRNHTELLESLFPRTPGFYDSLHDTGGLSAYVRRMHDEVDLGREILLILDRVPDE